MRNIMKSAFGRKKLISILGGLVLTFVFVTVVSAATQNAVLDSSSGTMHLSGTATLADAVASPDDEKFVQMGAGSWIIMKFTGDYVAVPDGTSAADLRVDIYDALFPASAEISVSPDGSTWTSVGLYSDTANIDLDLEGTGPVKYVKVDQGNNYIDPAYPDLGFDLDAVIALNAKVDADGDGYYSDVDCNDNNTAINPAATEICDGIDNNCDGNIDERLTRPTSNQVGMCSGNVEACILGEWVSSETNYKPVPDTCDKLDRNCDGKIDEHACNWSCFGTTANDLNTMPLLRIPSTNRWIYSITTGYPINFATTPPKGKGWVKGYTIESTNYCSCSQILNQLQTYDPKTYGDMSGHLKYGCSISVMDEYKRLINPNAGKLTGTWLLSINGGTYMHDMIIINQNPDGTLSGTGGYPAGSGPTYPSPYNWNMTGSISDNTITMTITYENGYTAEISGPVASDWNSMSGGAGTGGVSSWSATRI